MSGFPLCYTGKGVSTGYIEEWEGSPNPHRVVRASVLERMNFKGSVRISSMKKKKEEDSNSAGQLWWRKTMEL